MEQREREVAERQTLTNPSMLIMVSIDHWNLDA